MVQNEKIHQQRIITVLDVQKFPFSSEIELYFIESRILYHELKEALSAAMPPPHFVNFNEQEGEPKHYPSPTLLAIYIYTYPTTLL